jgi:acetyl-CoA carboxylase carboxyltransferase component
MFITGPEVIKSVTGEEINFEDLGGAMAHNEKSGVAQFACENDEGRPQPDQAPACLPAGQQHGRAAVGRYRRRPHPHRRALNTIIPDSPNKSYDMRDVIDQSWTTGSFLSLSQYFATNILTAFARLNGRTIGIIANQPMVMAGCLDINASDKATRFIRFCDAFNIPLLTIADVPGYLPGSQQEWGGIIRHGAKLLWCYSEATVPKLLLVTRKDYGGSYLAMCSKDLGADFAFAWPTAEIAVMGAAGAANIIHRKAIKGADDPKAKRAEKIAEYEDLFSNPYCAAERGYIDAVIEPAETRPRLIDALEIMCSKRELRPPKKHGNIPM